jgi:hypothetical protein
MSDSDDGVNPFAALFQRDSDSDDPSAQAAAMGAGVTAAAAEVSFPEAIVGSRVLQRVRAQGLSCPPSDRAKSGFVGLDNQ